VSVTNDGVALVLEKHGYHWRAWFYFGEGEYRWSKRRFDSPSEANEWGKRVVKKWRGLHDTDIREQ